MRLLAILFLILVGLATSASFVGKEGSSSSCFGAVRYSATDSFKDRFPGFITKVTGGAFSCSNAFFGSDPTPGVPKQCDCEPNTFVSNEGGVGSCFGTVGYGAIDTFKDRFPGYTTKATIGTFTCNNAFFGVDPTPGVPKQCGCAPTTFVSVEGGFGSCFGVVRYRATDTFKDRFPGYTTKATRGAFTCNNAYFGTDPTPGVPKHCDCAPTVAGIVEPTGAQVKNYVTVYAASGVFVPVVLVLVVAVIVRMRRSNPKPDCSDYGLLVEETNV